MHHVIFARLPFFAVVSLLAFTRGIFPHLLQHLPLHLHFLLFPLPSTTTVVQPFAFPSVHSRFRPCPLLEQFSNLMNPCRERRSDLDNHPLPWDIDGILDHLPLWGPAQVARRALLPPRPHTGPEELHLTVEVRLSINELQVAHLQSTTLHEKCTEFADHTELLAASLECPLVQWHPRNPRRCSAH